MVSLALSRRALTAAVLIMAMIALPLGVLASHQFADVPDSNPFHADIDALADSGVTTGCGGPNFCPDDNVTREQMAAFMNRLGALQADKTPVVNADKVDGLDSTALGRQVLHTGSLGPFGYQLMASGDGTNYYAGCIQMQLVGANLATSEIWRPDGTTYGPSYAVAPVFSGISQFVFTAVTTGASGKAVVYEGIIHQNANSSCTYTIIGTF